MASFTAHKFYGPKGIGGLYIDRAKVVSLCPQIDGGGHEGGLRSGTLNVPGIVGLAKALEIANGQMAAEAERLVGLRERLYSIIFNGVPNVKRNGHAVDCVPGLLNISFEAIDADSLLLELEEVALSSGSACASAKAAPSHVLKAIGLSDERVQATVRFGLGRFNTLEEVDYVGKSIVGAVKTLRAMAPI